MKNDILAEKRLREQRADYGKQIMALADIAITQKRDFTDSEDKLWRKLNPAYDVVNQQVKEIERQDDPDSYQRNNLGRHDFNNPPSEYGDDGFSDPSNPRGSRRSSQLDTAIGGWIKNAAGVPVNDSHVAACRSAGVSIHSGSFDVAFERSSTPKLGRDWFGRHERRAQGSVSGPEGGYTIQPGFITKLEQAMLATSGMLQVSELMTTDTGNDMPWPTTNDTDNEGAIVGENTAVSEQDIEFGQVIFRAHKTTSKLVRVSAELLQDSAFNLASEIGGMLGNRLGRIGNRLWTVGTGAGQPEGIVPGSTVGVTAASATSITADEILELVHSVDPSYRTGAKFMMNDSTILAVRKLKDGNGLYMWQDGMQTGQPNRLLGYEVVPNTHMAAVAASAKPIVFGALNKYKIRLAGAVRLRRLVERYAEYDQDGFVAFLRLDGHLLDAGTHPVQVLQMHA